LLDKRLGSFFQAQAAGATEFLFYRGCFSAIRAKHNDLPTEQAAKSLAIL
jgi:hypothetical protein